MSPRRYPTDLHILRAVAERGTLGAAELYNLSELAVRHRIHRLLKERGYRDRAEAVWALRHELERIAA